MPITVNDKIKLNRAMPSIDSKYGPYTSISDAYLELGPDGADVICIGLTVGIQPTSTDPVIEYWFKEGVEEANLVKKEIAIDAEILADSENPVQNKAIYTKVSEIEASIATKQPILTAGTNITIVDNVISAAGSSGGGSVDVDGSLDPTSSNPVANSAIYAALALKQDLINYASDDDVTNLFSLVE